MFHIGLDCHKLSSVAVVLNWNGKKLTTKSFPTSSDELLEFIKAYTVLDETRLVFEAGRQSSHLYNKFQMPDLECYVVCPRQVKLIAETKKKNDRRDARTLARLSYTDGLPERVYIPDDKGRRQRHLVSQREALVKQRTAVINASYGLAAANGIIVPKGYFTRQSGWSDVMKRAMNSNVYDIFVTNYAVWKHLSESIAFTEGQLKEIFHDDDRVRLMQTMPGVGDAVAWSILAYIQNINRFAKQNQLVAYAGLNASQRSSGETERRGHISKEGPAIMRKMMVQAALGALASEQPNAEPLKKFCNRIKVRKGWPVARVALATHMLKILFYILKNEKAYNPYNNPKAV